jgi:hypothetical protein
MCRHSKAKTYKNNAVNERVFCFLSFLNYRYELYLEASLICVFIVKRVKVPYLSDFDESINIIYFELLTVLIIILGLYRSYEII